MTTNKENFMRAVRMQETDGIPLYNMMWMYRYPSIYQELVGPERVGVDYFGVEWVKGEDTNLGSLPKPGNFILDDITKWRDVIKVPDFITDVDWEMMAKKQLDGLNPDNPIGMMTGPSNGFFQALISFMGFTEGLVACYEETEEVKALMEYLTDWACENTKLAIQYYKPDCGYLVDDIAHEHNPFISTELFREIFAPAWRRYYSVWLDADMPVGMHNCGRFEPFVGDLVDMGATFWDAVQSANDIGAIKTAYDNKIILCAGPEGRFINEDEMTEESVRAEFGAWLDIAAPGGGLAINEFMANIPTEPFPGQSEKMFLRTKWMAELFAERRYGYYK
ncbi:MAG: hypothetical protein FWH40_07690 [Coriobacteriia bacterium]|nr:hypothetical protein [Coriobacteriia bacterium]